jgi:hypothetical protein
MTRLLVLYMQRAHHNTQAIAYCGRMMADAMGPGLCACRGLCQATPPSHATQPLNIRFGIDFMVALVLPLSNAQWLVYKKELPTCLRQACTYAWSGGGNVRVCSCVVPLGSRRRGNWLPYIVVGRAGTRTCYPAFSVLSTSICFRALPAHFYIASVDSYPAIQAVFSLHERAFHLMARSILAHHNICISSCHSSFLLVWWFRPFLHTTLNPKFYCRMVKVVMRKSCDRAISFIFI